VDVDDLLGRVRSGLDDGDFTLLYLWVRFWANGGGACRADLDAVLRGRQVLSGHDTLVLGTVVAELYDPDATARYTQPPCAGLRRGNEPE
jgi:hypothetical protein